jgi:acylphosphatase
MLTAGLPLRSSGSYHESSLVGYVMTSLQVFYEGRVQGVGFRWTVRHIAKGFDVIGWVRNLIDGRVEMQVSGQENEVHAFINAIGQSELRSYIRRMTEDKLQTPVEANGFEIRHDY